MAWRTAVLSEQRETMDHSDHGYDDWILLNHRQLFTVHELRVENGRVLS